MSRLSPVPTAALTKAGVKRRKPHYKGKRPFHCEGCKRSFQWPVMVQQHYGKYPSHYKGGARRLRKANGLANGLPTKPVEGFTPMRQMRFCTTCGTLTERSWMFCGSCGSKVNRSR